MNLRSKICVSALAAVVGLTGVAPLAAAPIFQPKGLEVRSDVTDVQYRKKGMFRRDGDRAWYNGHRGYKHYRKGYREHNGFWFPAGAFLAGALITGAIINDGNRRGVNSHEEWCYNHYRTYNARTNTYHVGGGLYRECYSPYD